MLGVAAVVVLLFLAGDAALLEASDFSSEAKQKYQKEQKNKKGTITYGSHCSQETLLRLLLSFSPVDKGLVLLRWIVCTIRFTEGLSLAPMVDCKDF